MAIPPRNSSFEERQRAQQQQTVRAANKAQDDLNAARYRRVEPYTQETILKQDPALQRLQKEGKIKAPSTRSRSSASTNTPAPLNQTRPAVEEPDPTINAVARGFEATNEEIVVRAGFNIGRFRANINGSGVLPNHSYLVYFYPLRADGGNSVLNNLVNTLATDLTLRCDNVVLPTVSLLQEENIRRFGYGPVEKVPYGVQFSDVTMTWIADKYSDINNFFYQWMNTIVNYESRGGAMIRNYNRDGLDRYNPYEVGFRDSYACPRVDIDVFDNAGKIVTKYSLYEVFPMNIQSMNLSWADENQLQKMTITFAFTDMETTDVSIDREEDFVEQQLPPLPSLLSLEEPLQPITTGEQITVDVPIISVDPTSSVQTEKPFAGQDAVPRTTTSGQTQNQTVQTKDVLGNPIIIA